MARIAAELNGGRIQISGTCVPMTQANDSVHPELYQRKGKSSSSGEAPDSCPPPRCHTVEGSTAPEETGAAMTE